MSDGAERTEHPTPRRLEKARSEGDRPSSALATAAFSLWSWGALGIAIASFARSWRRLLTAICMQRPEGLPIAVDEVAPLLIPLAIASLTALGSALLSAAVCGGIGSSSAALRWRLERLSPARGLGSLFSRDAFSQMSLSALAVVAVLGPAFWVCSDIVRDAGVEGWKNWASIATSAAVALWWRASAALTAVAIVDVWRARRRHL